MKFHFIKFLIKINIFDEYYKINITKKIILLHLQHLVV